VQALGIEYVLSYRIFDVVTGLIAKKAGVRLRQIPYTFPWLPVDDVCDVLAVHGLKPAIVIPPFLDYRRQCCSMKNNKCSFNGTVPSMVA
jgi:hypothetical protein